MKKPTKEDEHQWARRWKKLGPILQEFSWAELETMSEEHRLRAVDSLLQKGSQFRQPRKTSGLVEWYRVLMKWRERQIREGKLDPVIREKRKNENSST